MSGDRRRPILRSVSKKEHRAFLAPPVGEPWIWLTRQMLASPAFRALSRAGFQLITCLMVEHLRRAGRENGRLAVSWNEFENWGINRGMIAQALDEVTRLGFVRVVDKGRPGYGEALGRRAIFRLTFAGVVGSDDSGPPTNDWQCISDAEASAIVDRSRAKERRRKETRSLRPENIEESADIRTEAQRGAARPH